MISPARPISPTCWCAAACAPSRPSACRRAARPRTWTPSSWRSSRAPSRRAEAVAQSLAALAWLQQAGCRQIYFKYCSTFDSTPKGNIGPVTDALMDALGTDFTIACPAFPGERPHDLPRLPVRRRRAAVGVGHEGPSAHADDRCQSGARAAGADEAQGRAHPLRHARPRRRSAARRASRSCEQQGIAIAIVDALAESDLHCIAEGCADLPLVTAGSGVGLGIAEHHRRAGRLGHAATAAALPRVDGSRRRPLGKLLGGHQRPGRALDAIARPRFRIDPLQARGGTRRSSSEALAWAQARLANGAGPDLRHQHAPGGEGGAAGARRRTRRRAGRGGAGRGSPRAWWRRACASWSWPAARPRAPWSARSASAACASARRSIPACRGPKASMPSRSPWRSSRATSAAPDFFAKALAQLE